ILHLMIIVGSVGCAAFAVREAAGRSITATRLFMPPMLAGGTAVILLLMAAGEPMLLQIWLGALVVGLAIGAYRGSTMVMRVDQVRSKLRMPNGRHAFWIAFALPLAVALEIAIAIWGEGVSPHRALPSAIAALAAGMLTGRAVAVVIRVPYAPNEEP
ncbi:MAG: hypothetical protein ACHQK9_20235, partial [Reyranellales bacterium]